MCLLHPEPAPPTPTETHSRSLSSAVSTGRCPHCLGFIVHTGGCRGPSLSLGQPQRDVLLGVFVWDVEGLVPWEAAASSEWHSDGRPGICVHGSSLFPNIYVVWFTYGQRDPLLEGNRLPREIPLLVLNFMGQVSVHPPFGTDVSLSVPLPKEQLKIKQATANITTVLTSEK